MRRARISMLFRLALAGLLSGPLGACAYSGVIPEALESRVDRHLTFQQLKELPDAYRGRIVMLGGEVLNAKRLKEGTRIEVLQLPLEDSQYPVQDRTASEGRFLAFQRDFLDPATIPPGTRVTVVGEVTGATTQALDETEYTYPTVEVKHLKIWPKAEIAARRYPYAYPYWRPYWWGWGRYPYWWW